MSNEFYDHTSFPANSAPLSSPAMRSELDAVEAGFNKLPVLTGNANKAVMINAGSDAIVAVSAATARTNLGLGGAALLAVGTGAGDVAAGNHLHTGTYQPAGSYQASDAELTAIAGLTSAADQVPYFTGSGTASLATMTAFARSILDDADEATFKATVNLEPGVDYQAYDVDTAKLDVDQTWTGAQRGTVTTDNDGSFDQSVTNNFFCTPSGDVTLTFTNHTAGQSGFVLFANTGGHDGHALAATTKADSSFLSTINATGTYLISYFDNGTNAYVTTTKALA